MRARAAAAALLAAGFALTAAVDPWAADAVTDVFVYRAYAELFLDGTLPYRDVGFEYPPLAALVIAAPGLVSTELEIYRAAFAALMLAFAVGVLHLTGRLAALTGGDERRALLLVAAAPLLTGAMIRTHFDLAPVLCLAAGLAAIAAARPRSGFALLGIGGAVKVFPLVAVPVAAAWLAGRGRTREALAGLAVAAAVTALGVGAGAALSPGGAWDAVEYHLERPVQVESMPAMVLNGLDAVGGRAPAPVKSHRSDGLEHPAAAVLTVAFALLLAAAVAALSIVAARLPDRRALVLAALGAAAAFATLGKVLSPQFMIWLVPLAALAWAWRMRALAAVTAASIATTLVWFPSRYGDLVAREGFPLAAVAVRNALLVSVLFLLARELVRMGPASPAAARSTSRARPGPLRSSPR